MLKALPTADVLIDGVMIKALVDSGCTQTIAVRSLVKRLTPCYGGMIAVDGNTVSCIGTSVVSMVVNGHQLEVTTLPSRSRS